MYMHSIRSRLVAALLGAVMLLLSQVATAQAVTIIYDPADGTVLVAPATVQISTEVLDVIDMKEASLRHNGLIVSRWTNLGLHYYTASNLAVGDHKFTVTATDKKGREYPANSVTVHVVATEPGPPPPPPPPPLSLLLTRQYVYDGNQQLCKVIEPETGATVYAYDGAGNLAWSAGGLSLPDPVNCNRSEAYASGRVVFRAYDTRNRLTDLSFPDGVGDQQWYYTPDGLPEQVVTINGPGSYRETVTNTYEYNRRRLLTREVREPIPGGSSGIGYGYSANGDLSLLTYPSGLTVDYAPNALGQPTRAGSYASGVRYHPNGAIASFVYGNGVIHNMTQNARQLPARSTDSGGALDHIYTYDAKGNVTLIDDQARGANYRRSMEYDGLDRLTKATSPHFGGDGAWHYSYDDLDNLRSAKLGGVQDHVYWYDAANRLTNVRNSAGATVTGLGYDVQGNLSQKDGTQFDFDYGNRLRASGGFFERDRYWYDAYGRRVWQGLEGGSPWFSGTSSQYNLPGQLLSRTRMPNGLPTSTEYVYLGGSLVASLEPHPADDRVVVTKYQHTDALGSPVAVTSSGSCAVTDYRGNCISGKVIAGSVTERTDYQPYGAPIGKTVDGVGYTGHVMDGGTGLTYMQERYYDAQLGILDSVDPVTAYQQPVTNFCRYCYARNNPYKFVDPDGRNGIIVETKKGNVGIAVPIKFVGPGATPANIASIKSEVAKNGNFTVSNGGKSQSVAIRVVDVTPNTPKSAINTITLTNGPTSDAAHQGASFVAGDRVTGEWNTQSPGMGNGEATHEVLHLVGAQDHYSNSVGASGQRATTPDSGWNGNLSAQIPGSIDNRNMSEINAGANGAQNMRIQEK